MRIVTILAGLLLVIQTSNFAVAADNKNFRVTLLGTGTPLPLMARFGPSILVHAGGRNLLFDGGPVVTQRLFTLKIPLGKIEHVFLTHLRSGHVVGIPDLWLGGALGTAQGGLQNHRSGRHG